nr:hypothetical protein [Tanacetum cinerariifolium]
MRYVDTKSNKNELRFWIKKGPYILTEIVHEAVSAIVEHLVQPHRVEQETYANTTLENRKLSDVKAEVIHMILNEIGDDIYSTVDACFISREMWLAIERLQQGESINKQDVKTMLFWEFGRNKLKVDTMQAPRPYKTYTSSSRHTIATNSHAPTRNKSEKIAKPITPLYESPSEEDSYPEQAQMDKDMQKNLALIPKQFGNQRTVTVARARETVDNPYHKEKMTLCKLEEKGVPLSAEEGDWLNDTDKEPDEQELEAHYMYMAKI